MRTQTLILAIVLPCVTTALGAQQKVNIRVGAAGNVSVRVAGSYASLRVVGTASDSLVLTGDLPRGTRFDPAIGSGTPLRGAKFYVEGASGVAPAGHLELRVPRGATVWAKAASASLDVSGIEGGLDLNVVGGSVTVRGAPRELNVESMDGPVTVEGTPAWLRVKTATGDITITGGSMDAALSTVGGAITAREGTWERVRIESITGSVIFGGTLSRAGALIVTSHSGLIDYLLWAKASVDIEAETVAGSILNGVTSRRPTPGREGRGEELTLNLGTGDSRATLRSFKGNIQLSRR